MRLVTFREHGANQRLGLLDDEAVLDVCTSARVPRDMLDLIRLGDAGMSLLREAKDSAPRLALTAIELLAPIPRPAKNIFCVGKNYHEHAREFHASGFDAASASGAAIPNLPIVFSKAPTTVIGPGVAVPAHLDRTHSVDYENEVAVIIGRGGRRISKASAFDHVFGFTIVNDVTSRTVQQQHKQWFLGKSIDGFCPMGPCILTSDEVSDVGDMHLVTRVNGEVRQDAYVRDLIFDIPSLIAAISSAITLEPGDIIATGTPAGVGIGFTPPKFLRTGDVVTVAIDPIGEMTNSIE